MKKGTVKALAVSGQANQIFRSGEKVDEHCFPANHWDQLVEKGFITEDSDEIEIPEGGTGGEAIKHILTDVDMKNNPELKDLGMNAGDEIEIPEGYRISKKGSLTKDKK